MRSFRRRFIGVAAAVSLVLCAAAGGMWVRSGTRSDCAWSPASGGGGVGSVVIYSGNGGLFVGRAGRWPRGAKWGCASEAVGSASSFTPGIGHPAAGQFRVQRLPGLNVIHASGWLTTPADRVILAARTPQPLTCISARYSHLTLLAGFLPAVVAVRWAIGLRQRRRGASDRCRNCGYNLTGNTSGICPECGTPLG